MDTVPQLFEAAFLGLVEGLTEFLPVSSTGHLILVGDLIGFHGPSGKVFEIVIQLAAILAVCWIYRQKILDVTVTLPSEAGSRRFAGNIILAFLPAAVIGALAHDFIKSVLFSPWVVSVSLVVGGFAILLIERIAPKPRTLSQDEFSPLLALKIGFCQVLAMIPGVSRSGATIMGAMLLGVDRRAATEFSFFLAIPTMLGATVYDLYKNWDNLDGSGTLLIVVGSITAFIGAMVVVRRLIAFISRHGFAPFAWYRIAIGVLMMVLLLELPGLG